MAMSPKGPSGGGENGEEGHYAPTAEINVTPMVDVMLVLLIIFMVAAPLLTVGVPIALPKTSAAAVTRPREPIILSVDRQGALYLGDQPVPSDQLPARLKAMAAQDSSRVVYVRGDRTISYGQMMSMLGVVGRAGFDKVTLLAEGESH